MKVINDIDKEQWRDYVFNHPDGNIFQTPEMYQVFAGTKGYTPELWVVTNQRDEIKALLVPVVITLSKTFKTITSRAVSFGSILHSHDAEGREALNLLLAEYRNNSKKDILFTELRNISNLKDIQPDLENSGFTYEPHLNFLINLRPPESEVFANIDKRTRKHIRSGLRRQEFDIIEVDNDDLLKQGYEILRSTYQNSNVPLADFSLFKSAMDILHPQKMLRVIAALVNDEMVGISLELLYKDIIYAWYGGVDRNFSKYYPGEIMTWDMFWWGSENGYAVYDFGGAGTPDEEYGVRDYKAKFGGELVEFGRNIYIHHPFLFKASQVGYQMLRRFISG